MPCGVPDGNDRSGGGKENPVIENAIRRCDEIPASRSVYHVHIRGQIDVSPVEGDLADLSDVGPTAVAQGNVHIREGGGHAIKFKRGVI